MKDLFSLTILILVPDFDEPITSSRRRKECPVRTERHMMDRRCCMAFPNALPFGVRIRSGIIKGRCFWITATNFKCDYARRFVTVNFGQLLVPHLKKRATGEKTRPFQIPGECTDVRARLQGASLHPSVFQTVTG